MSDRKHAVPGRSIAANDNPVGERRMVASVVLADFSPLPMEGFLAMVRRVRASVGQRAPRGLPDAGGLSDDTPLFVGGLTLADVSAIAAHR